MKKVALVVDFNTKIKQSSRWVDVYVIDRYRENVSSVSLNGEIIEEIGDVLVWDFVGSLQKDYEEVFYLLTAYDTLTVSDFHWKERLNVEKSEDEGKVYMYPIHYMRQDKRDVSKYVVDLYEAGQNAINILSRIDRFTNQNMFSINQLLLNYLTNA